MPITPDMLIGLYRGLVAEDPAQRSDQTDSVTDIYRSMSDAQVHGVALLLAALAVWESDAVAREAQLNALSELHAFDRTTADAIELLRLIDPTTLSGSQIEHFADLQDG